MHKKSLSQQKIALKLYLVGLFILWMIYNSLCRLLFAWSLTFWDIVHVALIDDIHMWRLKQLKLIRYVG